MPPRLAAALRILRRRALQAVGVAVVVSTLCFVIVQRLPGDIAFRIAAGRYGYDHVTAGAADAVRSELGLDRPAWQQLLSWWGDLVQFELGSSLVTGRPVVDELPLYLTSSLQLALVALALAAIVGTALGTAVERWPVGWFERTIEAWIAATRAVPPFLLGLLLILVFSVHLELLPATGYGHASNVVLPAATVAIGLSGMFAAVARDTIRSITASEFVRFAATKGLRERAIFLRHVVRNAGVTLVAYLGAQALFLIEGVLVVELVFAWPGLGHALVHAIFWRDIPMLQATTLALALIVVCINALVDLVSLALDPRPRTSPEPAR